MKMICPSRAFHLLRSLNTLIIVNQKDMTQEQARLRIRELYMEIEHLEKQFNLKEENLWDNWDPERDRD